MTHVKATGGYVKERARVRVSHGMVEVNVMSSEYSKKCGV